MPQSKMVSRFKSLYTRMSPQSSSEILYTNTASFINEQIKFPWESYMWCFTTYTLAIHFPLGPIYINRSQGAFIFQKRYAIINFTSYIPVTHFYTLSIFGKIYVVLLLQDYHNNGK